MKMKILCLDDDITIQTLVQTTLTQFNVISATTIHQAESFLQSEEFCAILVDIQLPDGNGLRFLTQISQIEKWKNTPILVLTNHADISNKVMAFSFGAEDFLAKPFDPIELNSRLTAKIKKYLLTKDQSQERRLGDLTIDFLRQKTFIMIGEKEKDLELTSIELKLLSLLTRRLEQVYSRNQILEQIWANTFITDRTIDSHIAHLRSKLHGSKVEIETVKNFGYRAVLKNK